MIPCMPDWNFEDDITISNQTKPMGQGNELVELLWQDGQVVLHSQSQTQGKQSLNTDDPQQAQKQTLRGGGSYGSLSNLIQDDETVSWIQCPIEGSFDKEFYSNFLSELPQSGPTEVDKNTRQLGEENMVKFDPPSVITSLQHSNFNHSVVSRQGKATPPPRFEFHNAAEQNKSLGDLVKVVNFSPFTAPLKGDLGSCSGQSDRKRSGILAQGEVRECSTMTFGSSHCGSNQVAYDIDMSRASSNGAGTTDLSPGILKDDVRKVISQSEGDKSEKIEPTVTSSSGRSGSSFNRTSMQSTEDSCLKRKSREAGESESQSEAAEYESAGGNKTTQRSGSCRRSRAAEVHNLSERRRRDRINEKMRALQELIPHCNKTDKASMLDEAIEYLKSLQLQLQVMWMGSGMAPMMFPGVQQYVPRMGMGMVPPPFPTVTNPMHFSTVPLVDQSMVRAQAQNQAVMCQTSMLNQVNYQNQMQNPNFSDQYAHFLGFHPMQTNSQPMNIFRFGSPTVQSQIVSPPSSTCGPSSGEAETDTATG